MTSDEKLDRLREWEARHCSIDATWDAFYSLTGAPCDSAIGDAIWSLWDAYTRAIGDLVGDEEGWLHWYWLENEMGKRAHKAGRDNDLRPIRNVDDLLWAIELEATP